MAKIEISDEIWHRDSPQIMFDGNMAKFTQNPHLKDFLLATGRRILVEASKRDKFWGVGIGLKNRIKLADRRQWIGKNQMGETLMEVRQFLRNA